MGTLSGPGSSHRVCRLVPGFDEPKKQLPHLPVSTSCGVEDCGDPVLRRPTLSTRFFLMVPSVFLSSAPAPVCFRPCGCSWMNSKPQVALVAADFRLGLSAPVWSVQSPEDLVALCSAQSPKPVCLERCFCGHYPGPDTSNKPELGARR